MCVWLRRSTITNDVNVDECVDDVSGCLCLSVTSRRSKRMDESSCFCMEASFDLSYSMCYREIQIYTKIRVLPSGTLCLPMPQHTQHSVAWWHLRLLTALRVAGPAETRHASADVVDAVWVRSNAIPDVPGPNAAPGSHHSRTYILHTYRVGKKRGHRLMTIILSNLNRFTKFFIGRFLGKFADKCILKISPHLAYVATLSRETLMSVKQAINSKLPGSYIFNMWWCC